jgi:GxxExxY protein
MLSHAPSPLEREVDAVVHRTIGCALSVHRTLGPGFLESIYHRALRLELEHQQLKYETERPVPISYRGNLLHSHRVDLIVESCLVVEIKAVERLERVHTSQVVSYLRATNMRVGLLINFNTDWLKGSIRRIVF